MRCAIVNHRFRNMDVVWRDSEGNLTDTVLTDIELIDLVASANSALKKRNEFILKNYVLVLDAYTSEVNELTDLCKSLGMTQAAIDRHLKAKMLRR